MPFIPALTGVIDPTTNESAFADEDDGQLTRLMYTELTQIVIGSGVGKQTVGSMSVSTGTTAGSTARMRSPAAVGIDRGTAANKLPWQKRIALSFRISFGSVSSDGIFYIGLGCHKNDTSHVLIREGIGLQFTVSGGLVIPSLSVKRGSLGTEALGLTLTPGQTYWFKIESFGNGNSQWSVDGVNYQQWSNTPKLLGNALESCFYIEAENQTDESENEMVMHDMIITVTN